MKKAIAIFFCLQVLTGNTFAEELVKLPMLIRHYFEHEKTDHPDLSFTDFLWEHYGNSEQEHEEEENHCDKLPFKHCHHCSQHHSLSFHCVVPEAAPLKCLTFSDQSFAFDAQENLVSFYNCCIWQPPKLG